MVSQSHKLPAIPKVKKCQLPPWRYSEAGWTWSERTGLTCWTKWPPEVLSYLKPSLILWNKIILLLKIIQKLRMLSIKLFLKDTWGFKKCFHHLGALCVWNFMKMHFCGSLPRSIIAHWALSSRKDHPPPTQLDRGSSPPLLSREAAPGHHPLPRALPLLLACPCSLPHDGAVAMVPDIPAWSPHGRRPHV